MVKRIYRTLKQTGLFEETVIYSKYRNLELEDCKIQNDTTRGILIDSIVSAISTFGEFLAVGGDLPMLDYEIVSEFVKNYLGEPIAAVDFRGTVEPLFAIYNESIYNKLLEFSKKSKKIFTFVEKEFRLIKMDEGLSSKLLNVNTRDDLDEARRREGCLQD